MDLQCIGQQTCFKLIRIHSSEYMVLKNSLFNTSTNGRLPQLSTYICQFNYFTYHIPLTSYFGGNVLHQNIVVTMIVICVPLYLHESLEYLCQMDRIEVLPFKSPILETSMHSAFIQ